MNPPLIQEQVRQDHQESQPAYHQKGKTRSLVSRFENYKDSILMFADDFNIESIHNCTSEKQ